MKKDKKEETMNPFIKEAWICRTGAIFQRFSVARRQVRGERESEPRARGGVKKKKNPRKNTCTPMHTKIEKPQKTFPE